ncbi:hypothetical protein GOODEAATRI_011175 [Goodea atripinnis]|uniref:Uncharacterized protein n=1 Tax=Goodea atripinnis TaxID=208336 RepID=A0ABV0MR73_9TELE
MKHCFQAVNGECSASFTPLHLKWSQLAHCESAVCFSAERWCRITQTKPGETNSTVTHTVCLFTVLVGAVRDNLLSLPSVGKSLARPTCKSLKALCVNIVLFPFQLRRVVKTSL